MLRTKKKTAPEDALKLTSSNLPQDLIKIEQPRKNKLFFLLKLKKMAKEKALISPRDCLDTKLNNNVVVICCQILLLCHRTAVQPRRGGRSAAQHNAPRHGLAMPSLGVPDQSERSQN